MKIPVLDAKNVTPKFNLYIDRKKEFSKCLSTHNQCHFRPRVSKDRLGPINPLVNYFQKDLFS
jgi:hypothetical protein